MLKNLLRILLVLLATMSLLGLVPPASCGETPEYELHEWGVFTVPRNAAWANLDMKAEWASMPKEFYGQLPGRNLPYNGPVKKPVIYFHAEKPLTLKLNIRFADGVPTVWWPAVSFPTNTGRHEKVANRKDENLLTFRPTLIDCAKENHLNGHAGQNPRKLEVPAGHWVEKLREVKASEVFCEGSRNNGGTRWDSEHFIYYDGLMRSPPSPKVSRDGSAVVLETESDHDWLDVLVIEREKIGFIIHSSWIGKIEAGKRTTKVNMPCLGFRGELETIDMLRTDLVKKLSTAGLNSDEALALAKVWDKGLFYQEGLTVFYRISQETYEKWLPLDAQPAPKKTVRVGLVLHSRLEPELDARMEKLIANLGAEPLNMRDAAQKELLKIGGAAFPLLEKASKSEDVEISKAAQFILQTLDARSALPPLKE